MSATTLKELLVEEIQDIYHAEKQLVKALPKMAKAAQAEELKAGFLAHLEETQGHVRRLEQVFKLLDEPIKAKPCKAMEGLVEEGDEGIKEHDASPIRDALLIGAAQRVEHYEIAAYGTVRAFAEELDEPEIVDILQQTLDEEGATDKKLTELAATVNAEANSSGEDAESQQMVGANGGRRSARK